MLLFTSSKLQQGIKSGWAECFVLASPLPYLGRSMTKGGTSMFLLEDGNAAAKSPLQDKRRKGDALIGVVSSAAVILYVILSLLSARAAAANSVSGSQSRQEDGAVGQVISTNR
jgi:hypothetical protein